MSRRQGPAPPFSARSHPCSIHPAMTWRYRTALAVSTLGAMVGCGSSHPAASPSDGAPNDGAQASALLTASGTVTDNASGAPIPNAKACILDHPEIPCAATDADGKYTIELPAFGNGLDIAGNVTASGFLGETGLTHEKAPTPDGGRSVSWFNTVIRDDAAATKLLATQAGFAYPASGKGFVLLAIFHGAGGAYIGQTVAASPASGGGPVYADPSGAPDPTLTAVTSDGYVFLGGLIPGRIEITTTGAPCTPVTTTGLMWASTKPHTIAGEVAAGSITRMSIICAE